LFMVPVSEDPERRSRSHEARETAGASVEVTGTTAPHRAPEESPMQHRIKLKWSWWWLLLLVLLLPAYPIVLRTWDHGGQADAQSAQAQLDLSLQRARAHRYQECVDAAKQAVRLKPDFAEAYNNIGYCSASMGRWNEGIRNMVEALRINPESQLAVNNLSWMLREKAKDNQGAQAQLDLSLQRAQAHRYPECVDAAQQAVKLKPDFAEAYNNIGYCYASMGRWDDGIRHMLEALRINPDSQLAGNNLIWMLQEKAKAGGGHPSPLPPSSPK